MKFLIKTVVTLLMFSRMCADDTQSTIENNNDVKTFHIFYGNVGEFMVAGYGPTFGIGYRCHKAQNGLDISATFIPIAAHGHHRTFFPLVKASYLYYPCYAKNNFFYAGIGVAYVWPFLTIGREFCLDKPVKLFIQLEATYPAAALSLGIGF